MSLSVENLYQLKDDDVVSMVTPTFEQQLQLSPSVHSTFFSGTPGPWAGPNVDTDIAWWIDTVAVVRMCCAIGRSTLYHFGDVVHTDAADEILQNILSGKTFEFGGGINIDGQIVLQLTAGLYAWAFRDHCTDGAGTSFLAYLNDDPEAWGVKLADYLTTDDFINVELNKLVAGQPNWLDQVNLAYFKVQWLCGPQGDQQEARVVKAWTAAYKDAVSIWRQRNLLNGMFPPEDWIPVANAAISVATKTGMMTPRGMDYDKACYGNAVNDFLRPTSNALTTGPNPNNCVDLE
jgi:hypothetical protein